MRIPIGYWAYDTLGSAYVSGARDYIDAAIDWSRGLGLKIIIDLHGAPGSQNGYDNSGQRLDRPSWQTGNTVQQTLQVLKTISQKYAKTEYQDVVIGIQLLNEPALYSDAINFEVTKQFYRDGYGQVRDVSDTPVILHDGFRAPNTWNAFLTPQDNNAQNVAIDHHEYQIFNNDFVRMSPLQHQQLVCSSADSYNGADKWTCKHFSIRDTYTLVTNDAIVVGEWTGAMTDCAKYLNGYGRGARYDGTFTDSSKVGDCGWQNDVNQWSQSYKDDTRKYIEAQIAAYEKKTQGWFWWNFKTESAAEWDAFKLIDAGVFPAISNGQVQFKFGTIC